MLAGWAIKRLAKNLKGKTGNEMATGALESSKTVLKIYKATNTCRSVHIYAELYTHTQERLEKALMTYL